MHTVKPSVLTRIAFLVVTLVPELAFAAPGGQLFNFGDNVLDFMISLGPYVMGLGLGGGLIMAALHNRDGVKAAIVAALAGGGLMCIRAIISMVSGMAH
jgi:hypothetical protein